MNKFVVAAIISLVVTLAACGADTGTGPVTPPAPPSPPAPSPAPSPPAPGKPSSSALIDEALTRGEIDADSALKYKVFAAFNDTRLPAKFTGDDSGVFETNVLRDLNARFDSLSSENQSALAAFLLRPSNKGSWANPVKTSAAPRLRPQSRPACDGEASGWSVLNTANLEARVWYRADVPDDLARALVVADAIDTKIWPSLITTLGFKEPLDDSSVFGCYGGDSRLDVYLVTNVGFRALAQSEGLSTKQNPAYIMLNTDELSKFDSLRAAVTHEIMHAIQFAYPVASNQDSYGWLRDAMANWAIDHVYAKTIQLEQEYADCFTSTPALSLDDRSPGHCKTQSSGVNRDYGAYLFFQFIARTVGASAVRNSLEATVKKATSLEAVDSSIPGGFKEQWWKFAKTLWNQGPIDAKPESFKRWDNLIKTPQSRDFDGDLKGAPEAQETFETTQNNLSSRYYRFTFSDPDTRSILFYNGFFDQIKAGKAVKIMALWRDVGGTWQEEDPSNAAQDWSQYKYVGLCRDLKNQRATELLIIVTNAEKDPGGKVTASQPVYLKRNNVGCYKYTGQSKVAFKDLNWSGAGAKVVSSDLTFELDAGLRTLDAKNPTIPDSLRLGLTLPMQLSAVNFTYEDSHVQDACSFSLPLTAFKFAPGFTTGFMFTNPFKELESSDPVNQGIITAPSRAYYGLAIDPRPGTLLIATPASEPTDCSGQAERQSLGGLLATSDGPQAILPVVKPDGTMQGNINSSGTNGDWTLSPESEP
jgi:hypothetical protein